MKPLLILLIFVAQQLSAATPEMAEHVLAAFAARDVDRVVGSCHPKLMKEARRALTENRHFYEAFVAKTPDSHLDIPEPSRLAVLTDAECLVIALRAVIEYFPEAGSKRVFGVIEKGEVAYVVVEEQVSTKDGVVLEPYPFTMRFEKDAGTWKLLRDPWTDLAVQAAVRSRRSVPNPDACVRPER